MLIMETETLMKIFKHTDFSQTGRAEIMAEASTLGLKPGIWPSFFVLEHAGTFKFMGHESDGTARYEQTPGFLTAVILSD